MVKQQMITSVIYSTFSSSFADSNKKNNNLKMKNVQLKLNMEKYSQAKWFFFLCKPPSGGK